MKKVLCIICSLCLVLTFFSFNVYGEDYSDTSYWVNLCTGSSSLSENDIERCRAYRDYVFSQSKELNQRIAEIDAKKDEIVANIQIYIDKINEYQSQIDALQQQIDDLTSQIEAKQKDIDALQAKIDEQLAKIAQIEAKISALRDQVKNRMAASQATMHTNVVIEVLFGASTFSDFLRIANGLDAISKKNKNDLDALKAAVNELEKVKRSLQKDQAALQKEQDALKKQQDDLFNKTKDILALQYESQTIKKTLEDELARQNANRDQIVNDIANIQQRMRSIANHLDMISQGSGDDGGQYIPNASGFFHPIPGGRITPGATSFAYSDGSIHLGADYGVNVVMGVTSVNAVGDGVILYTHDGCPTGYYGSSCGAFSNSNQVYQSYWNGGGNQIVLLFVNNGGLYAAKYYHLYAGSLTVGVGDIVSGGQTIAKVGSSGSSTGTHLHIEIFYLGSATNFSSFAQNWDGELEFHTGWGSDIYSHICDQGASAPCKVHPESLFGY